MRAMIGSERLTALTDGVVAVIITIMVLELKPPHGATLEGLRELGPTFLSFALSFVYVAIYWMNHHHFFKLVPHVSASIMWSNLNLLFWLSLIPFATAWMDDEGGAALPVMLYGVVLLLCGASWRLMQVAIVRSQGVASPVRTAIRRDVKARVSTALYIAAIALALVAPVVSCLLYAVVAGWWLVPDRRVEAVLAESGPGEEARGG